MNELSILKNGLKPLVEIPDYRVTVEAVRSDLNTLYLKGHPRGVELGWKDFDYSILPGATTYIMGHPTHGKSYFLFEILLQLSQFHGWRHMVFSPETGAAHNVYSMLIGMYMCKSFFELTPDEMEEGIEFIDKHFIVVDPIDKNFSIDDFLIHAELEKVQTLSGDPFNEFTHDFRDDYNRQDLYIERMLTNIRKKARATNLHIFIANHAQDGKKIEKDGIRYLPKPMAIDHSGGKAWWKKGAGMLCAWRPPVGLNDNDGRPYEKFMTIIDVQKAKPEGIGTTGEYIFFFDPHSKRYYMKDKYTGNRRYAGEQIRETTKAPF